MTTESGLAEALAQRLRGIPCPPDADEYVPSVVDCILAVAVEEKVSDVHLIPDADGLNVWWRVDGMLYQTAVLPAELRTRIAARLKVLSGLLTYRTEVPQEGRLSADALSVLRRGSRSTTDVSEVRVATFPGLHGEKTALRIFAASDQLLLPEDLGYDEQLQQQLLKAIAQTGGVVIIGGPSGSGKTTTAYACIRQILRDRVHRRMVMTLEDPIEVVVPGAVQSQVRPSSGFDLTTGLKSAMRQDPDVIMIGEIRDPETAAAAFQAALTGHLIITTFHCGDTVEAVTRLLDMGIEPYLIRSALRLVTAQRLLRRRCSGCGGLSAAEAVPSAGCAQCRGTGFAGRFPAAEGLCVDASAELAESVARRADAKTLRAIAYAAGVPDLRAQAESAVRGGTTTAAEVFRVFGHGVEGLRGLGESENSV